MPNWVYNSMSVSGKREDLLAFAEKAKRPRTTEWITERFVWNKELGKNVETPEDERKIELKEETPDAISFWNFIRPTDEQLPYYFGHLKAEKPEGFEGWTQAEQLAHSMKFEGDDWYNWNIREWGTKWDAGSDELDTDLTTLEPHDSLLYRFETAWSVPEPIFRAMVEQHPELDFDFHSEEEQGWGVTFDGHKGEFTLTKEWDIPSSHAEYQDLDREDSCVCNWDEDTENWFEDCPRPEQDFYVVVTKTYRVRTNTAENAWELAQENDPDEQMELMDDYTQTSVTNEHGERLYPTLNDGEPKVKVCEHKYVPLSKMIDGVETLIGTTCVFCNDRILDTETASV